MIVRVNGTCFSAKTIVDWLDVCHLHTTTCHSPSSGLVENCFCAIKIALHSVGHHYSIGLTNALFKLVIKYQKDNHFAIVKG